MAIQKDELREIYKGSFKKPRRFDDGGYANYVTGAGTTDSPSYYSGYTLPSSFSQDTLPEITVTGQQSPVAYSSNPFAIGDDDGLNPVSATTVGTQAGQTMPTGGSGNSSSNSSSGSSAAGGALGSLLKALGLGGSGSASSNGLAGLAGLLSAAGQYSQNKALTPTYNPPALFGGAAGSAGNGAAGAANGTQYGPNGGYNYQNYQGLTSGAAGTGYAPRTQMAPVIPNYYTYGQGPQASFFTGSQGAPSSGSTNPIVNMAKGGHATTPQRFLVGGMPNIATPKPMAPMGGLPPRPAARPAQPAVRQTPVTVGNNVMAQRGMMRRAGGGASTVTGGGNGLASWLQNTRHAALPPRTAPTAAPQPNQGLAEGGALSQVSRHVKGPGDGTSDDIPARLANGEYVMDAQTVAMLGNGDNGAGAKKLDGFRENIRKHKGSALAKGKMAPDAKDPQAYLPKGEQ